MSFLEPAEKCWLLSMLVALAIMGARRGTGNLLWERQAVEY